MPRKKAPRKSRRKCARSIKESTSDLPTAFQPIVSEKYLKEQALALAIEKKYGNDIRGPNSHAASLVAGTTATTLPIPCNITPNSVMGVMLSVASYAVSRGWSLVVENPNYIYWSVVYQTQLLLQAAQGGVPFVSDVPQWLAYITQALIKTTSYSKSKGRSVSYQFNIPDTLDSSYDQRMGPGTYGYFYSMGIKDGSNTVNGVIPVYTTPVAYTQENGQLATQSLWLFLSGVHEGDPMHKMVSINEKNKMTGDPSAFAWSEPEPGGGYYNTGGWDKNVWTESTSDAPLFACFVVEPGPGGEFLNRSKDVQKCFSGDSVALGGFLVSSLTPSEIKMRKRPDFKFVDFLEYANVLAIAVQEAMKLRLSDPSFQESIENDPNYFIDQVRCPLTLQEFLIMLRATVLSVHRDQHIGQSLYPNAVSGTNVNRFVSYICGVNTTPIPVTNQMLMPMELQLNILANASRSVTSRAGNGAKSTTRKVSILGQYNYDELQCESYLVEYNEGEKVITDCIFAPTGIETTINLVDGRIGSKFAGINDPACIMVYVDAWNRWIQGMSNNFRNLTSIATDAGLVVGYTGGMTTHWKTKNRVSKKKEVTDKGKYFSARKGFSDSARGVEVTHYKDRELVTYTCSEKPFNMVWTLLQQYYVTPINTIDRQPGALTPQENTGAFRMAGYLHEYNQINVTVGTGGPSIEERHRSFASLMVKRKFSQNTGQQEELLDELAKGRTGILGQLVAGMAGNVAHLGVDVATQLLGESIPL